MIALGLIIGAVILSRRRSKTMADGAKETL
jgi:hypothetical protein